MNYKQSAACCQYLHIVPFCSEWRGAPILRRTARIGYVALLIAASTAALRAQGSGYDDPCIDSTLTPIRKCPHAVPPDKGAPNNISDGTKRALECEWIDSSNSAGQVFAAFELLTSGSQPGLSEKVLDKLQHGRSPLDQSFLTAAIGDPDTSPKSNNYGQPRAPGLPNFLDLLAKANRIVGDGKSSDGGDQKVDPDEQKIRLFKCTKDRIDDIFNAQCDTNGLCATGPSALERVNDAFSNKNNYVALYELLNAAWQQSDEQDLEKLRAAFAVDANLLAKQVAAKITAPKN